MTMTPQEIAADLPAAVDQGWTMFAGCLVFFMQAGFALLESGAIRQKATQAILVKNMMDMCVGGLGWLLLGFGLAFGEDNESAVMKEDDGIEAYGGFVGTNSFFPTESDLDGTSNHYAFWFFQFTFCATASTIVSGALAERCRLEGFALFTSIMTSIIYPIVVHWTWGYGWLANMGFTDFAGSGIVHLTGGTAALVGAAILGPRLGRFTESWSSPSASPDAEEQPFTPSSILSVTLGTLILWFGWFGFNGGSTVMLSAGNHLTAGRAMTNTTIAGSAGGLVALVAAHFLFNSRKWDVMSFCNGILGGLVGITAGCNAVETYGALVIGITSAFVMLGATKLVEKLKIDDAIGAFPVHGACGMWGCLMTGCFHTDKGIFEGGSFARDSGKGCFLPNLLGCLIILCWTAGTTAPVFLVLKKLGLLRCSAEVEKAGLDSEFTYFVPHLNVIAYSSEK